MSMSFSSLPDDIIYLLGNLLNEQSPIDSYNLMILSKRTQELLLPIIYSSVHLRNGQQCSYTLRYLQRCPTAAFYVRKLTIKPGDDTRTSAPKPSMEEQFAHTLEQLAPSLKRIVDLTWDGSCLPKSATFWQTFQKRSLAPITKVAWSDGIIILSRCPELRYIGTAISQQEPFSWDEGTGFLGLKNLRGLSVNLKSLPPALGLPQYLHAFPSPFWKIIQRSPKLQQLCFEGDVPRSFDFKALFAMELPSLKILAINATIFSNAASSDLVTFLHSTPQLNHLDLSSFGQIPWDRIEFSRITHCGGNLHSVLSRATHWRTLRSLDVSWSSVPLGTAVELFKQAHKIPSLMSLKLHLTFEDPVVGQDHFGGGDAEFSLLPTLARCCPNLTDLDVTSSTGSTLHWDAMFHSLADFPRITDFRHTHVPPRSGRTALQIATTALTANSNIEQVTIRRSLGPWYQKQEYKTVEKVVLRYIDRRAMLVSVHCVRYEGDQPWVSNSNRLSLSDITWEYRIPCI